MKKVNFIIGVLILCSAFSCFNNSSIKIDKKAQQKEITKTNKFTYKQLPIAGNAYLRFYNFDEFSNLYFEPKLIINSQKFSIENFDSSHGNHGEIKSVSPNGNYFIMDLMMINNKKVVENIGCAIIDIPNKMIVRILKNECNGEWNKANQWLFDGEVVVSFD